MINYSFTAPAPSKTGSKSDGGGDLKQTRRRLSVMSDNKLIEGIDGVNLEESETPVTVMRLTFPK